MKKRSLSLILCAVLALGFMANAPAARAATWEAANELTLALPSDYEADLAPTPEAGGDPADPGEEPAEPADPVGVVVDLYLLAEAQPWTGYDAYIYTDYTDAYKDSFKDLPLPDMDTVTTEDWQAYTWNASELVLQAVRDGTLEPTHPNVELGKLDKELVSGLYLLIPHGKGMEPEQYITSLRLDGAVHPATLANSKDYTYTFQPQLVSLPAQGLSPAEGDPEAPGVFNGSWEHEVTVTLKPDQQPRFGKLTITKGIDYYEEDEPATFVFEVTATKDINADGEAEEVYRNTVALTFSKGGDGSESITLDRVPAGSHVTVKEVYSGAFYTAADDVQEGDLTVDLAEGLKLAFENKHGTDQKRGHGIINQFSFDGEHWDLDAVDPNAAEPAPEA